MNLAFEIHDLGVARAQINTYRLGIWQYKNSRCSPSKKESSSVDRWEGIAHAVNEKGATEEGYITKDGKACQEKFYKLMSLCGKE